MTTKNKIVELLKECNGLDIVQISKRLDMNIRDVQQELIQLQDSREIVSGMRKYSGESTYFDRVYTAVSR